MCRSTDKIGFDGVDDRETLGASNNSAQKCTHACYFSKSPVYSKFLGLNRRSVWFFFLHMDEACPPRGSINVATNLKPRHR